MDQIVFYLFIYFSTKIVLPHQLIKKVFLINLFLKSLGTHIKSCFEPKNPRRDRCAGATRDGISSIGKDEGGDGISSTGKDGGGVEGLASARALLRGRSVATSRLARDEAVDGGLRSISTKQK